ncbi:outer membrane beta-barrel protein [Flavobacterium antarcticum]|uniref:outer membrane beta-barrel protein n=1 Tax=Flavobacterium antarcticum TaxID=271155 RepID=UPI0003B63879|nr:outer membrane beta-barrel protein [Flavobacterium antarcticum]
MKTKFLTAAALICTFFYSNAQVNTMNSDVEEEMNSSKGMTFDRGNMFVEGGLKITTGGEEDAYAVNAKVGYFLSPRVAVGGQASFGSIDNDVTNVKTDVFGIGAFARYYFLELDSKRLKAYGEAGLGFGKNKTEGPTFSDNNNSVTADINLGLNYFFTKNFAATFTLANVLSYNSVSPENGDSVNKFELNVNLFENIFAQPQFGLLYKW